MAVVDISGMKFGKLTVTGRAPNNTHGCAQWFVKCDCGNTKVVLGSRMRSGHTSSCGCARKGRKKQSCITDLPEYWVYQGIKRRCYNPNEKTYDGYGGRGIRMDDKWRSSFDAFLSDMGKRPNNEYTIERIDVDGDYTPDNCMWVHQSQQALNKRNTIRMNDGQPLAEYCRQHNIKFLTIYNRMKRHGISADQAIHNFIPKQRSEYAPRSDALMVTVRGVTKPLYMWCEEFNIPYKRAHKKIQYGNINPDEIFV